MITHKTHHAAIQNGDDDVLALAVEDDGDVTMRANPAGRTDGEIEAVFTHTDMEALCRWYLGLGQIVGDDLAWRGALEILAAESRRRGRAEHGRQLPRSNLADLLVILWNGLSEEGLEHLCAWLSSFVPEDPSMKPLLEAVAACSRGDDAEAERLGWTPATITGENDAAQQAQPTETTTNLGWVDPAAPTLAEAFSSVQRLAPEGDQSATMAFGVISEALQAGARARAELTIKAPNPRREADAAWKPGFYGYDPASDDLAAWGPFESPRDAATHPAIDAPSDAQVEVFRVVAWGKTPSEISARTALSRARASARARAQIETGNGELRSSVNVGLFLLQLAMLFRPDPEARTPSRPK